MKKIRIKISIKQQTIYIKDVIKAYIKRIEKDLRFKIFKYHSYIKYYIIILKLVWFIKIKKTINIIFNKELRIIKEHLIIKD